MKPSLRKFLRVGTMSVCIRCFAWIWIFLISSLLFLECSAGRDVYCRSLDIRNSPEMAFQDKETNDKWSTLSRCTVMEGDFSVSMITSSNYTHESFPVFTNLRVITGHLLVFQVSALRSLKKMFPNLRVIGGQELIMNYALVIYQNTHLVEIGLPKLTTIINGGIRVMDNAQLCYSRYINWASILIGPANDIMIDQSRSPDSSICTDDCSPQDESRCHKVDGMVSCWDGRTCQLKCDHARNEDKSPGPGCDDYGNRCHEQCLGGCSQANDPSTCHYCRNVVHNGVCVEKCPSNLYELHHVYLVRRCVTVEECKSTSAPVTTESTKKDMLIVDRYCRVDCPAGQEIDPKNSSRCIKCEGYCPVKCKGGTIDSFGRINDYHFKKCNVIEGYLEIELRTGLDAVAIERMGEALGSIEIIEGYLLIDFSTSFVSLHMFKRLRLIKGNVLWRDRYALAVFENPNLRQIFDLERQSISIGNGTILFQNNRMLCYNKIKALIDHIGLTDVEDNDVSYYSNGDRAICNETKFDVHTEDVHSFGFMISWTAFNTTDMDHRKFLGYQVFFKKVDGPNPNLSIYDDRSACSDSWSMHFEPEKGNAREGLNRGTGLFGLDSNTWYAYYVQTKLINHPGARNAISVIHFVKTLFSPPDPPRDVRGESNKPDEIELEWEPPERPNGDITHYIVKWQWLPDDLSIMSGHVCDDKAGAGRRQQKETSGMRHHVTVAPSTAELGTCSKQAGCCECNTMKKSQSEIDISAEEAEKTGEAAFENAVQNLVFVQHDVNKNMAASKRVRRAPLPSPEVTNIGSDLHVVNNDRAIIVTQNEVNETTSFYEVKNMTQTHKVNVTTLRLRIAGLRHYTQYQIWVHACQNVSAVGGAYCSQRPGWMVSRTLPIPENDLVDNSTIRTVNTTGVANHRSRKLFWKEPESPNGAVLAYKVKVISEGMTPIPVCVKASKFRNDGGVTFNGLPEGEYRVEIRTISMASYAAVSADEVVVAYAVFRIITPSLFTWKTIALIFSCIFLVLLIASLLALRFCRPIVGKRWQQYIHQQITANPEYFSQMDVYKPDEWELNRDDIHLEEEIGRGTFGKVYRGYADNILSQCGKRFGDCAVKTVAEGTNSTERIHFLFEASVMKQFNTSFIVKLYGVVSDGQPVLVVMELMEKGNLRDYLRSRRPDSEENIDHLPVPTNAEYVRWAAQIADGMAYLESLKFCHRDLAARNCMVNQRDNVKIGDFGMARDLYYHEYYKPTGTRLMAVRWMAPESLRDGKFTMKSDVWSYGIVLYEMLTLAQQPYTGIGTEAVFQYIGVSRRILARPTGCPDFWYDLMVKCWKFDPRERPDFAEIVADLIPYTEKEFIEESFVVNDCTKIKSDVDTVDETMHLDELCLTSISDNGKLCMDIAPIDEIDKKPVCNWNRRNASTSLTSARRPGNLLNAVNGPANELRPTHLASAEDDDL